MKYFQINGTPPLKEAICQMYPGATIENILVTIDLHHQSKQSDGRYHDYTTITTGALNDRLARLAMRPETRAKILQLSENS